MEHRHRCSSRSIRLTRRKMVFPGMNPRSAAGNKVAAAIIHAHAEKEVEATREAAAKVNVVEGVLESLKYGTWKVRGSSRGSCAWPAR